MGCACSKASGAEFDEKVSQIAKVSVANFSSADVTQQLIALLAKRTAFPIPADYAAREVETVAQFVTKQRQSGVCRVKVGRFGAPVELYCKLRGVELLCFDPGADPSSPQHRQHLEEEPLRVYHLLGCQLESHVHNSFLLITPEHVRVTLEVPDEPQHAAWTGAFKHVPGMFRRAQDYFQVGEVLGRGHTCTVQEAVCRRDGRRYALKHVHEHTLFSTQSMHNELRILQLCAKHPHPAIPHLQEYFMREDGRIDLVLELMHGGELYEHVMKKGRLAEDEAHSIFVQILAGVAHLHSLGISHRDLKPQNILFADAPMDGRIKPDQIKIIDYDIARVNAGQFLEPGPACGTTNYMAPEVVRRQPYSVAVDMWSLGVILYCLLSGHQPFASNSPELTCVLIEQGRYAPMQGQVWDGVSVGAKDLIRCLLVVDADERLPAQPALDHPWVAAISAPMQSVLSSGTVSDAEHQLNPAGLDAE